LEFLFPIEQKKKIVKMQEIINGTYQKEKYEIMIQTITFENESYYKGFIDAKINYFEHIAPHI
jgi:hypothetical protein